MRHRFKNNKQPLKRISLRMPQSDFEALESAVNDLYTTMGVPNLPVSDNLLIQRACTQAVQCLKNHAQRFGKK
jgi:hypothetical protein